MKNQQEHPIRVVARRTGLTAHVIRVWEKRYRAVIPKRTETNRRFYTDDDINRLILLKRATQAGRSIGQIANLPTETLEDPVRTDEAATRQSRSIVIVSSNGDSPEKMIEECLDSVKEMDAHGLEVSLSRGAIHFSRPIFLEQVISPLMTKIGEFWKDGSFCVAHEHLASALVRTMIGTLGNGFDVPITAPCLVVTTPSVMLHELGALLAASTAASVGWRVTYLGPNLPAEEIARAAKQSRARAVALSLLYPADDSRIAVELQKLRKYLDDQTTVIAGGRAADAYDTVLTEIHATKLRNLGSLRDELELLRNGKSKRS